jgi:hypothetical protein
MKRVRGGLLFLVACSMGAWIASGAGAGEIASKGACNATIGMSLQYANQIKVEVGDVADQCAELGALLNKFGSDGCFVRLEAGELAINRAATRGSDQADLSPLGETICSALVDVCGFGGYLPPGVCTEI